ncbi:hypothetical protein [Paraglaciecola sp. L3A3]|uniref:hypothetical protein n=1 Tax=Paraglaciecola sp. L3A3 TaxID=2686358 RepID=UPI00131A7678|nr:hypothetical protein [Paraglaciecola sp. L3A3]
MIDSIGGGAGMPPPPPRSGGQQSLTEEQTSLIEETLANYDADNLTEADAASMVEAFAEAGITPSRTFADQLAGVGFDAREIGELAKASGPEAGQRPPPPPADAASNLDLTSAVDYLETLFEEKAETENDNTSITAKLAEKFGLAEGESLVNITV